MRIESVSPAFMESTLFPMMQAHYDEVPFYDGSREFDPDMGLYQKLYDNGNLLCFVAIEESVIVGYVVVIASPSFHHRGYLDGAVDCFYVAPEYRGKGVMSELMLHCQEACSAVGIDTFRIGINANFEGAEFLAKSLGMDKLETHYITRL